MTHYKLESLSSIAASVKLEMDVPEHQKILCSEETRPAEPGVVETKTQTSVSTSTITTATQQTDKSKVLNDYIGDFF